MIVPLNKDDLLTSFNYQWFFEVLIYRSNHPKTNPRNLKILQNSPKIAGQWMFTYHPYLWYPMVLWCSLDPSTTCARPR